MLLAGSRAHDMTFAFTNDIADIVFVHGAEVYAVTPNGYFHV